MNTTRERQTRFIRDFPERVTREALHDLLARKRLTILDVLPDDVVAELTEKMAADWRDTQHRNARNRAIAQAQRSVA